MPNSPLSQRVLIRRGPGHRLHLGLSASCPAGTNGFDVRPRPAAGAAGLSFDYSSHSSPLRFSRGKSDKSRKFHSFWPTKSRYPDHAVIETTLRYIVDATPPPARHPGSSVALAFDPALRACQHDPRPQHQRLRGGLLAQPAPQYLAFMSGPSQRQRQWTRCQPHSAAGARFEALSALPLPCPDNHSPASPAHGETNHG